jgi:hypothetical protein
MRLRRDETCDDKMRGERKGEKESEKKKKRREEMRRLDISIDG